MLVQVIIHATMLVQVMMQMIGDGDVYDTLKWRDEGDENEFKK
jgi:hypothetical protein